MSGKSVSSKTSLARNTPTVAMASVLFLTSLAGHASSETAVCGPKLSPYDTLCATGLSNHQGHYRCDNGVKLVTVSSVKELQAVVRKHAKVKAVGAGGSWHGQLFCAGSGSEDAVNVQLLTPAAKLLLEEEHQKGGMLKVAPELAKRRDFPIQVNLKAMTVTVEASLTQRVLLEYLLSLGEQGGYLLGSVSAWLDQTLGGAVANGVHGSSTLVGSLSEQVLAMEVVHADGSLKRYSAAQHGPLFRSLQVSLGRLGIMTELTFPIVHQPVYDRVLIEHTPQEFEAELIHMQGIYKRLQAGFKHQEMEATMGLQGLMQSLDGFMGFYNPVSNWTAFVQMRKNESAAEHPSTQPVYKNGYGPLDFQPPAFDNTTGAMVTNAAIMANAAAFAPVFDATTKEGLGNATGVPAYEGLFITDRLAWLNFHNLGAMNMYEAAVPLASIGTCIQQVRKFFREHGTAGFVDPILLRFGKEEQGHLAYGVNGPIVWLNLNDWTGFDTPPNTNLLALLELLRDGCGGKFHWGKAGWDSVNRCFDGGAAYPTTWCHYGCAVQELDPKGKFAGQSSIWQFRAQQDGQDVPFASCCRRDTSFDYKRCACASAMPPGCATKAAASAAAGEGAAAAAGGTAQHDEL